MRWGAAALAALVALAGCGRSSESPPAKPADAAPLDACGRIAATWRAGLAGATNACATPRDCNCWQSIAGDLGCGGMTDAVTAKRLRTLRQDYLAAGCKVDISCPLFACEAECVDGICRKR